MSETPETNSAPTTPTPSPNQTNPPAQPNPQNTNSQPETVSQASADTAADSTSPAGDQPASEDITLDALSLPEGFDADSPLAGEFLEILNAFEPGDAKEVGNALLDMHARMTADTNERWLAMQDEWRQEIEADPKYGGTNLEPALGEVSKSITEFARLHGGDVAENSLREAFEMTGAGNNPHVIKYLIWMTNQLSEGTPLSGQPAGGDIPRADKLYGT